MVEQCVTFVLRYYHSCAISVLPCRNKNINCDAIESEIGQHYGINEEENNGGGGGGGDDDGLRNYLFTFICKGCLSNHLERLLEF